MNKMVLFLFSKITTDVSQVAVHCASRPCPTRPPFTVGLQELYSQDALLSPFSPWEPRHAPNTQGLSLTPPRLCSCYPLLEWPFPALYSSGNLLPFFTTRLKCSFFRVAFPTCPHSLGQQIPVEGPRSQVLMSQKPTVRATLRHTMRGHLETRKRYQGSSVDVLNVLVAVTLSAGGMRGTLQDG